MNRDQVEQLVQEELAQGVPASCPTRRDSSTGKAPEWNYAVFVNGEKMPGEWTEKSAVAFADRKACKTLKLGDTVIVARSKGDSDRVNFHVTRMSAGPNGRLFADLLEYTDRRGIRHRR